MAKFKARIKITGLEVEIEGEREDVPRIADNLKDQVGGLIEPAADIADENRERKTVENTAQNGEPSSKSPRRKKKRSKKASSTRVCLTSPVAAGTAG